MSDERTTTAFSLSGDERGCRQAELLSDAEFIWSVLANSGEGIMVLDRNADIQFIGGALRAMGIDGGDALIGTSWLGLWRDEAHAQAAAAVQAAKAGRIGRFEASRLTAKRQPTWWDVTVAPIRGGGGKTTRLLVVVRNITERRLTGPSDLVSRQELHHRVKNTLAIAMAITSESLARAPSLTQGRRVVERRLMALADVQTVVHESGARGARLHELVERIIAPHDSAPSRFAVSGEELRLSAQSAVAIGMALHELSTNAVQHGTLSAKGGQVEISWRIDREPARVRFIWRERGGLDMWAPISPGFGMRIIEASFRDQLGGRVEASLEPSGVLCVLDAPLSAVREPMMQNPAE